VAYLGYPAPGGKKHFCALTNKNSWVWSEN